MTVIDINRFDEYRAAYNTLSYDEHRDFYRWVAGEYPTQTHWDAFSCGRFLHKLKPDRVVELGGWDGGLASVMLQQHRDIDSWVNYEIADVPQACPDERFQTVVLDDWFWSSPPEGDVLVASHVLEHLSLEHLQALLDAIDAYKGLFVTTPLPSTESTDWTGYPGSHILPLSWDELDELLQSFGWMPVGQRDISGWYVKNQTAELLEPAPPRSMRHVHHPPGTIIVAAGEFLRFGGFVNSMIDTVPSAPPRTSVFIKQSVSIVENLNDCIRHMPSHSEWLWIQADDQMWKSTALPDLLDCDVDVVVPLITRRSPPFTTLIFKDYFEGQGYLPFDYLELPSTGMVEVFAAGTGGMLVKRHVLEAIGWPKDKPWEECLWFEYEQGQRLNEDFVFCRRIREAGFKIHCCVDVQFGHRGMFTAWPVLNKDGKWGLGLNMGASSNGKSNTLVIHSELQEVL